MFPLFIITFLNYFPPPPRWRYFRYAEYRYCSCFISHNKCSLHEAGSVASSLEAPQLNMKSEDSLSGLLPSALHAHAPDLNRRHHCNLNSKATNNTRRITVDGWSFLENKILWDRDLKNLQSDRNISTVAEWFPSIWYWSRKTRKITVARMRLMLQALRMSTL
jgi:hypothetical protein